MKPSLQPGTKLCQAGYRVPVVDVWCTQALAEFAKDCKAIAGEMIQPTSSGLRLVYGESEAMAQLPRLDRTVR